MNRSSKPSARAEALAAFSDSLDAVADRVATGAPASNLPPELPEFFSVLARNHLTASSCGTDWNDRPLPAGVAQRLARVDRCLAGASGIAELLHAGMVESDDPALSFNNNLTDRLHFALGELLDSARTSLDAILESGDRA